MGRSGNIKTPYDKYVVTESRDAYGFVRAFMLTGKEQYLTMARQALDFMYQHHWDTTHGGWMTMVDRAGNRATRPGRRRRSTSTTPCWVPPHMSRRRRTRSTGRGS